MGTSQVKSCGACDAWIDFTCDSCTECGAYQGLLAVPEERAVDPPSVSGRTSRDRGWMIDAVILLAVSAFAVAFLRG